MYFARQDKIKKSTLNQSKTSVDQQNQQKLQNQTKLNKIKQNQQNQTKSNKTKQNQQNQQNQTKSNKTNKIKQKLQNQTNELNLDGLQDMEGKTSSSSRTQTSSQAGSLGTTYTRCMPVEGWDVFVHDIVCIFLYVNSIMYIICMYV